MKSPARFLSFADGARLAMRSVPGAVATGFRSGGLGRVESWDPVATAPGTDRTLARH